MDALGQSIHDRCSRISERLDRLIESDAAEHALVERPRPFTFDERAKDHVSPLQSSLR